MFIFILMILAWLTIFNDSPNEIQGPPHQVHPLSHECNQYPELHYTGVDLQACKNHIDSPKYKRGQVLRIKHLDNDFTDTCKFEVGRGMWNPVDNRKTYIGTVVCLDANGKYEKRFTSEFIDEDNLKK